MSQGYSLSLVEANRQVNSRHLGVALGRVCIKARVPVMDVADYFGVSRQGIYNWFKGVSHPRPHLTPQIEKYMEQIGRK
jgi:hypothetical protein